MRNVVFALAGNSRLGARLAAVLHDMGHTVFAIDTAPGPLRDMALTLAMPTCTDGATPVDVEWLLTCDDSPVPPNVTARHTMKLAVHADAFPPRRALAQWRLRGGDGSTDRLVDSRECRFEALNCGADVVFDIEAAVEEMLVDIVGRLGRDALDPHALPAASLPADAVALDLHATLGWHAANETRSAFTLEATLPEMIGQTACATPDAIAIHDVEGDVTYRAFAGAAMKLSHRLSAMAPVAAAAIDDASAISETKAAPRVVAVRLRKSRLLYVAMVGAIGAGAAYLPLDPSFPAERVRAILEQSRADVLITDDAFDATRLADLPLTVLRLTTLDDAGVDPGVSSWPVEACPDRATRCAITIFTSGSTGTPKGVMLTHRNIVHFCHWYRDYIGLDADSRVLQFCTVAFDVSLLDIFPTFLAGATLYVPTEEQRHALDELSDLIGRHALTHAFLPPALLAAMPDAHWPALRHLLTGGDVCFPETIERWSRGRTFHNIFGPAECTVLVTIARLAAGDSNRMIGQPIANVRCYVLDETGRPVRTGESGELCVAGAGVADGYLLQPELTDRSFVRNPFSRVGGTWPEAHDERLYRTGDIVQWDQNGLLHFVGRRDAQVKIRGFRVELGEIESAVLRSAMYGQCACVVDDKKRIRAFVAKPLVADATAEGLRVALEQRLPDFMLPHEVVVLERLPATNNGKIDRSALARMPSQRAAGLAHDSEPANDTERALRALWATLLDLDEAEIGRDDSFFHLGGHSLLVSKLMLAVKLQFAGNAPLARFMERPTIAALATLLTDGDKNRGEQVPSRVFDDMRLPEDIQPLEGLRARGSAPRSILLTGANGFLGSFIAAELIAQTDAELYCLVRASDEATAQARLDAAFRTNGLAALAGHPRIKVVVGDLAKPHLGLAADTWRHFARTLDAIYHNGAHVNHFYDYPYLYDANVGSTLELLRLACERRNKSMHFVSTLSAASAMDAQGHLLEAGPAMNAPAFVNNGYNVTKWVSEHLVWEAAQRGIDATILRPGNITGVASTGHCLPDKNRILLLMKGSLQLGFAPDGDTDFDFSPVDFLARAIVCVTLDSERSENVFHLQNPRPLTWSGYLRPLERFGYALTLEDPERWRKRLPAIDESNALFDVVAFYLDDAQDIGDMSRIDCARTSSTLARLGVRYPEKDASLLDNHFRFLIESGFLPPLVHRPTQQQADHVRDEAPQSA